MSSSWTKSPSQSYPRAIELVSCLSEKMKRLRMLRLVAVLFLSCRTAPLAQAQLYAGVLGGVATLSGDARSLLNPASSAFSSYDPKNGGAVEVFVGRQFSDYFAVQANYIWNGNRLKLTSAAFNNGTQQGYQETRQSAQQSLIGDLLVYFRNRDSRLRPYLSVGTGLVHFSSSQERIEQPLGAPALPPQRFSANMIALHVPVGMDVKLGKSWAFRYTFSETLSKNPISDRLSPPGQHRLMNFQNLFGFTRRF
jgi:outer membrane protein with beta-barrel domain